MALDLQSVETFLRSCPPFDHLPNPLLSDLIRHIEILYRDEGDHSDLISSENPRLYIVRKGAVDILGATGELLDRVDPGTCFGISLLMTGKVAGNRILVTEEALLYAIPMAIIQTTRQAHPPFDQFFQQAFAKRFTSRTQSASNTLTQKVRDIMTRDVVSVSARESAVVAARKMTDNRVSSVLVLRDDQLIGILTDRDIRARLVANEADMQAPIEYLMTPSPITISPDALAHEATFRMLQQNIHHLPVVEDQRPVGLLSASDLMRTLNSDPVYLVGKIAKCQSVEELQLCASRTQQLLFELIRAETSAESIGQIITGINDNLTKRLIELAQAELGEEPVPFCWVSFGSQARLEQHAGSDQDNGIIFDGGDGHQSYFLKLAERVCSGLNACGFPYCPGDVMAQNPQWCQNLDGWMAAFSNWIDSPQPKALMYCSIFFDIRPISGDFSLSKRLQDRVLSKARKSSIFLAMLAKNALNNRTPLGFFNQFIVAKGGDHHQQLDLKHQGLALITDIARLYALSGGVPATSTPSRLRTCEAEGLLTSGDAANLLDAFAFISQLRFQQQLRSLNKGQKPTNFISPKKINSLQRNHLKAVFRMLDDSQNALSMKFTRGMA